MKRKPVFIEGTRPVPPGPKVISVGAFDGIHRGHRFVIERMAEERARTGFASLLFTFDPHPRQVFRGKRQFKLLTVKPEKIQLLAPMPLDYVVFHPFDRDFAAMTGADFLRYLKEKYGLKILLLGYDHVFGSDRLADDDRIREIASALDVDVKRLPPVIIDDKPVSSTLIKQYLGEGRLEDANRLLGYPYLIKGKVVHGSRFGRRIGFPTANIRPVSEDKFIPAPGVYAVEAEWDGQPYPGVMNIGVRPTVDGTRLQLEVHLLDFEGDLYGQILDVYLRAYLRPELTFDSVDDLRVQIGRDIEQARRILSA
ncbi:MAG: bifunctional riboflavin kinase/FAD synthetase [Chlorobi bacterium]|nr:bifunctional riboflavin kinase/FAD synthetase [Chlorobiota bacterium]